NVIDAAGADLTMPSAEEARPAPATPREPAESLWWAELIAIGIFMVWPLGALVLLSRSVIGSMRFAARLRRLPVVSDTAITELLEEVARVMLIRRVPKVKYVPGLSAPALFASLRPTLCLPETDEPLSRNELRMVFIHELAHLVRYDGIIAWLLTVVQAVH